MSSPQSSVFWTSPPVPSYKLQLAVQVTKQTSPVQAPSCMLSVVTSNAAHTVPSTVVVDLTALIGKRSEIPFTENTTSAGKHAFKRRVVGDCKSNCCDREWCLHRHSLRRVRGAVAQDRESVSFFSMRRCRMIFFAVARDDCGFLFVRETFSNTLLLFLFS